MQRSWRHFSRSMLVAAATLGAPLAFAAEVYYQPIVSLSAETDSNLDLDPGVHQQVEGYLANAATIIGIDTPNSTTTLRPKVIYRYYPKDPGDDRLEGYFDFNSSFHTQRSTGSITGSLQHLDEFNAESTSAVFNDVNPTQTAPDTGKTVVGATRDSAILSPKYLYSFTPTLSGGASAQYMLVNYSPSDATSHVDFDYYQGRAFLTWSASQRSELSFGGFGSKFETKSVASTATGGGALVNLNTFWTPLLSTTTELLFEHTDINSIDPPITGHVNKIGGSIEATYKTETERFRLIAKRSISPSGASAVYLTDRLQLQYDRSFTARFSMTGAVLGVRTHGLTANLAGDDHTYAQTLIEAHYMLTKLFFLQGGYQYAFQKYQNNPQSAVNNRAYIQIGYQGLGQQR